MNLDFQIRLILIVSLKIHRYYPTTIPKENINDLFKGKMTFFQTKTVPNFTKRNMKKYAFSFLLFVTSILLVQAEQLYVNSKTGNDSNSGTKEQPLKPLWRRQNV